MKSIHIFATTLSALLIFVVTMTMAGESVIENLSRSGVLDQYAGGQSDVLGESKSESLTPGSDERQQAVPFHFVMRVDWPEGQIPGDVEGVAAEVMSIFADTAADACQAIPNGPGPTAWVTFPTPNSVEYMCASPGDSEAFQAETEDLSG